MSKCWNKHLTPIFNEANQFFSCAEGKKDWNELNSKLYESALLSS